MRRDITPDGTSVLDAIGHTPLVELRRVVPKGAARVVLKLESANPTGGMKDRVARAMLEPAIADGRLPPGGTVVEYTGGTTAVSLAFLCAALGYRAHFVFSEAFSDDKRYTMLAYGARLAERLGAGATVATLVVDSGLRYLSTDVFGVRGPALPPAPEEGAP